MPRKSPPSVKRYVVWLEPEERERLEDMLRVITHPLREVRRGEDFGGRFRRA